VTHYSLHRDCATPGCTTRVYGIGVLCAKCFALSPEGKHARAVQQQRRRYELLEDKRLARGDPAPAVHCTRCIHWHHGCGLGFPEGVGSFAEDCAVFSVTATDTPSEILHPDVQDMVQHLLERAYVLAGRTDRTHPYYALYTNVFGELKSKGISI